MENETQTDTEMQFAKNEFHRENGWTWTIFVDEKNKRIFFNPSESAYKGAILKKYTIVFENMKIYEIHDWGKVGRIERNSLKNYNGNCYIKYSLLDQKYGNKKIPYDEKIIWEELKKIFLAGGELR